MERPLDLNGVYHLSHLALVNIPYLGVRIYLWSGYGSDISIFVMKNVIGILWHIKDVVPDFVLLRLQCRDIRRGRTPGISSAREDAVELELWSDTVFNSILLPWQLTEQYSPIIQHDTLWFHSINSSQSKYFLFALRTQLEGCTQLPLIYVQLHSLSSSFS